MIQVILASDENYVQHLGVTMASLLHNCSLPSSVSFLVVNDGLLSESKECLSQIARQFDAQIAFTESHDERISNLPTKRRFSTTAYCRLLIPEIVPDGVEKVVYLDCDVLVRHDIAELWQTDITAYPLGAVTDLGVGSAEHLGIPQGEPYFNSGVLLINVPKWRELEVSARTIHFVEQNWNIMRFHDQDALNAVLRGKWLELHPSWNVYRILYREYYKLRRHASLPACYLPVLRDPAIVHFTGSVKPWHYGCCQPFVEEYHNYLSLTPWRDLRPTDMSIGSALKRSRWIIKKRIVDCLSPWIR